VTLVFFQEGQAIIDEVEMKQEKLSILIMTNVVIWVVPIATVMLTLGIYYIRELSAVLLKPFVDRVEAIEKAERQRDV